MHLAYCFFLLFVYFLLLSPFFFFFFFSERTAISYEKAISLFGGRGYLLFFLVLSFTTTTVYIVPLIERKVQWS